MRKILIAAGIASVLSPAYVVLATMEITYNDVATFPGWASDSILSITKIGFMTGYEDGNFGPDNYVTRAELATILNRQEWYSNQKFENFAGMYADLERDGVKFSDLNVKQAIALASAKINEIDSQPEVCLASGKVPANSLVEPLAVYEGYSVYKCHSLFDQYFVNFQYEGKLPESDGGIFHINRWFGPYTFSPLTLR